MSLCTPEYCSSPYSGSGAGIAPIGILEEPVDSPVGKLTKSTIGTTTVLCYSGLLAVGIDANVSAKWSRGASVPMEMLDPTELSTKSCGTNTELFDFDCDCMTDYTKLQGVIELEHHPRVRSYMIPYYSDSDTLIEECVTVPNQFISVLVLSNVSMSDQGEVTFEVRTKTECEDPFCLTSTFTLQPGKLMQ